jgi:hypothetical protein
MVEQAPKGKITKRAVECKPEELDNLIKEYTTAGWKLYKKYDTAINVPGRGSVVGFEVVNF